MNNTKRKISVLLVLIMFLSSFSQIIHAADTQSVSMRVFNLEGDSTQNDKSEFWGEETINATANVVVSGDGVKIENPWLVIKVAKLKNKAAKPQFVDSQNAYLSQLVEDDNYYYMVYKLNVISGGTNMAFPFPFKFIGGAVENGDAVNVDFQMLQGNGENKTSVTLQDLQGKTVLYSAQKTYTAKANWLKIDGSHINMWHSSYDRAKEAHQYSMQVSAGDTTTGAEGRVVYPMFSETISIPANTEGRVDYKKPNVVKMEFEMPEFGQLTDDAKRAGWTYDESTKKATLNLNNPEINYSRDSWRDSKAGITSWGSYIKMVNAPFNNSDGTPRLYTINAKYYVDNGDGEQALPDRSVKFYITPTYFSPGNTFGIWKDNINGNGTTDNGIKVYQSEGAYVYYGDKLYDKAYNQEENGLIYTIALSNTNNGSSIDNKDGGITSKVWNITDTLLTRGDQKRIYYKAFTVAKVKDANSNLSAERRAEIRNKMIDAINSPNKLYGIKEDGSKHLIKENIKYEEKVVIDDVNAQYVKVELELSKAIELNNSALSIVTQAYPSAEEIAKFKNGDYAAPQYYYGSVGAFAKDSSMGLDTDVRPAFSENQLRNSGDHWGYTSISSIRPRSSIGNSGNQSVVYSSKGTYLTYWTDGVLGSFNGEWGPLASEPIENVKLIQLLPVAFDYENAEYKHWYDTNSNPIGEPEVIANYKNTGRTAVIYTIPKYLANNSNLDDIRIGTRIKATPYAERGNNLIESFLVYENNDIILPMSEGQKYKDVLDLDNDGDREEIFARASSYIN